MEARSNGEGLGTSTTLRRGKATGRKDGEREGTTFLNMAFSFPHTPVIPHTSFSSIFKLPLVKQFLAPGFLRRPGGF